MARKGYTIDSMETLMKVVPLVIEKVNIQPELAFRFAANPLFLVEELGYTLTDDMQHYAARRVRFPTDAFNRLNALEGKIWKIAGERFDLDSGDTLGSLLFGKMKLPPPDSVGKKSPTTRKGVKSKTQPSGARADQLPSLMKLALPLPPLPVGHGHIDDPLEPLRGLHPIIEPLLEYRQLEASSARLAPRALYDRIARGDLELPVTKLTLRWKPPQ